MRAVSVEPVGLNANWSYNIMLRNFQSYSNIHNNTTSASTDFSHFWSNLGWWS